jgi:hypothetical protein
MNANNTAIVDEATVNDGDGATMDFALERLMLFRERTFNQKRQ